MAFFLRLSLLICALLSWQAAAFAQPITIRSASVQAVTASMATAVVQSTTKLPHRWDKAYPGQAGTATYVLDMPALASGLAASHQPIALYIPRLGNQAHLSMRRAGQRETLQQFGMLGDAYYDASKSPQWITLPSSLNLASSAWQLEIVITAQPGRYAGLSSVSYGTVAELAPLFNANALWRQTSSQIIVISLGLLGLLAAGFWWKLRDASFGLFAITACLGLIRMSDRLIPQTWLAWPWWGALMATAYAWHLLCMIGFSLHVAGSWQRSQRIALLLWMMASAAAAWIGFGFNHPWIWTLALSSMALPGLYAFYALLRAWQRDRSQEVILLALCGLILMSVGVRDFLSVRLATSEELTFSLMPIALFSYVLTMAWIIVDRYSQQVQAYRELNHSLESRVAQTDRQLKESYTRLKATDEEKATLTERARIMRDIHDGVGAQLVGLVTMLQTDTKRPEELREHAQNALDELRMAVDSLQPVEGSLSTVLATLRYRLQPRLKAAGLDVLWEVDELPRLDSLTPTAVLQVQRILLEAFTNVIRHSEASVVQVRALHISQKLGNDYLSLCIDDNGSGSGQTGELADTTVTGQGQKNMRWRAQSIGAQLYVEQSPLGGVRIRLEWPVEG